MKRIYISGPMTGLPGNNFPAFEAAKKLIEKTDPTATVISPHEIIVQVTFCEEVSWERYLRADLKAMLDCDLVVILPGWHNSKGAMLEIQVAHAVAIPIISLEFFKA